MIIECSKEACDRAKDRKYIESKRKETDWLETASANLEFDDIPDGWKANTVPQDPGMGKSVYDYKLLNATPYQMAGTMMGTKKLLQTSNRSEDEKLQEGWKIKFKQENISKYFKSQEVIDFDKEMKRLEKERLLELKRLKELEWFVKRKVKKKEVANKIAKEYVNNIIEEAWDKLKMKSIQRKNIRLKKLPSAPLLPGPAPGGSLILRQHLQNGKGKVTGMEKVHPLKS